MSFQFFRRPGTIVLVDDDVDYLTMLSAVMPPDWTVRLYSSPLPVIELVKTNFQGCLQDLEKQREIIRERGGNPIVPRLLAYLSEAPDRFSVIDTIVSDYAMPPMDGLKMFHKIGPWTGARILLTGFADEGVAIQALNAHPTRLIEQYVRKQSRASLAATLRALIQELTANAHAGYAQLWRSELSAHQLQLLNEPDIARALMEQIKQRWVEHFVVANPFGVLGVDQDGRPGWLQLEPVESLAVAAELAKGDGASEADVQAVREGRALTCTEAAPQSDQVTAPAFEIGASRRLLGAVFHPWPALASGGYRQWREAQPARELV